MKLLLLKLWNVIRAFFKTLFTKKSTLEDDLNSLSRQDWRKLKRTISYKDKYSGSRKYTKAPSID
jgi:hypothetical protein